MKTKLHLIIFSLLLLLGTASAQVCTHQITAGGSITWTNFTGCLNDVVSYHAVFQGGSPGTSGTWTPGGPALPPLSITYSTPGLYPIAYAGVRTDGTSFTTQSPGCTGDGCIDYVLVVPNTNPTTLPVPAVSSVIGNNGASGNAADPVNTAIGAYGYTHTDLSVAGIGGLTDFSRSYNTVYRDSLSVFGYGWNFLYGTCIKYTGGNFLYRMLYPDGHTADFYNMYSASATFAYPADDGFIGNGGSGGTYLNYTFTPKNGFEYFYNTKGKLDSIWDNNRHSTILKYTADKLDSIIAPGGSFYKLTYNSNGLVSSLADNAGRTILYAYDANSNLISVTDPANGATSFQYDNKHQITKIILPKGNTLLSNTYTDNQVTVQADGVGNTTTFSYNTPVNHATTITNPDNSTIIHYHDSLYRLTKITDEQGKSSYFTYDVANNLVKYVDVDGAVITQSFDASDNLIQRKEPLNRTTTYSYTSNSLYRITDALGANTTYGRIGYGNISSVNYPDNTFNIYTFNNAWQVTQTKDANNNIYNFTYNSKGSLSTASGPQTNNTYAYDSVGRLLKVTDAKGNTTGYTYDNNGNITVVKNALAQTQQMQYDANGNLTKLINKNNNATTFTYDNNDRLVSITLPNGGTVTRTYDSRNNLTRITDMNGNSLAYTYDNKKRITGYTNKLGGISNYGYDVRGNVTYQTSPDGENYTYTYDALNRLTNITNALNQATTKTYNLNGIITDVYDALGNHKHYDYTAADLLYRVTDESNNITSYRYDNNHNFAGLTNPMNHALNITSTAGNKPAKVTNATGGVETFGYDTTGNLTSITKPNGVTAALVYDALNRPTAVTYSTGETYNFTYDALSNILTATCAAGTEHFTYDNMNRMTAYADVYGNTLNYKYDVEGNRAEITYPGSHTVKYTFNSLNQVKTVTDWNNNVFTYTYNNAGHLLSLIYPNGLKCDYAYDAAARLTAKNNYQPSTGKIITKSVFTLDAAGRRVSESRTGLTPANLRPMVNKPTYTADDVLMADSLSTFANDSAGNRTFQKRQNDSISYSFTADNLLKSIIANTVTTLFDYDAFGRKIKKTLAGNVTRYVNDASGNVEQMFVEQDGTGQPVASYIYGNGLLERIDANNKQQFYHFDASHNVVALSDYAATVTDSFSYEPFGRLIYHGGTTNQPFYFLGEYGVQRENDSLYYARARYYDAAQGRFISKDPYPFTRISPKTINRFVYAQNNPHNVYDYTGLYGSKDDDGQDGTDDNEPGDDEPDDPTLANTDNSNTLTDNPYNFDVNSPDFNPPPVTEESSLFNNIYTGDPDNTQDVGPGKNVSNELYNAAKGIGSLAWDVTKSFIKDVVEFPGNVAFLIKYGAGQILGGHGKQVAPTPTPPPVHEPNYKGGLGGDVYQVWFDKDNNVQRYLDEP